jgi:SagB-type dehydrogenase family enzyme
MSDPKSGIADLFHENTTVVPYQAGVDIAQLLPPIEPGVVLWRFRLPRVTMGRGIELEEAIIQRASCRWFDPLAPVPLASLSRLIAFGCGFTTPFAGVSTSEFRRAAPSAGGRYPIELYPVALRVEGLLAGAYRYDRNDHSLELLRPGLFHQILATWTLGQPWVADAGVVFVLAGFFERVRPRYGQRGYRHMLLEAGHIAQNLYLLGAAYSLGILAVGGFVETAIDRLLGLDETSQFPLYLVAVGMPRT